MQKKNNKKFRKIKKMILSKFPLWRQEDTRSVFQKKMKDFWEIIKKRKIKEKENKQNVLMILKMVS